MNTQDIEDALQFLEVRYQIVLQVPRRQDIPYVKREIFHRLGQPRKILYNTLFYGDREITIEDINDVLGFRGFSLANLFYIRYEDNADDSILASKGIEEEVLPFRVLPLWKSCHLSVSQMYHALLNDGYSLGVTLRTIDLVKEE